MCVTKEELEETLRNYEQMFWLASRDLLMFHQYNAIDECWDDYFHIAINCGDTFCLACADAEDIAPEETHKVRELYEKFGWSGIIAYVALKRNDEPLEKLRDAKYLEAKKELNKNNVHSK